MMRRSDSLKPQFTQLDPDMSRQFTFSEIQAFLNAKAEENGQS
jgi:hypothetical protein